MREVSFGETRAVMIPDAYSRLTMSFNGSGLLAWSEASQTIATVVFDTAGNPSVGRRWNVGIPFQSVQTISSGLNPELLLSQPGERSLTFARLAEKDSVSVRERITIPVLPELLVREDVNGDGQSDFFVVERRTPGIRLVLSGKRHTVSPMVIAPDLSVGALCPVFLNNDNLVDLVVYDWVRSELHILYGVGKGRFLDESVFPVAGEITSITAGMRWKNGSKEFFLLGPKSSGVQVWRADRLGDFLNIAVIAPAAPVHHLLAGDVNRDGLTDLVLAESDGVMEVRYNGRTDPFQERSEFQGPGESDDVVLMDADRDGDLDAVVTDARSKTLRLFLGGDPASWTQSAMWYAVGMTPMAVAVGDDDGDGIGDVHVALQGTSALGILRGRKGLPPSAIWQSALTVRPNSVSVLSLPDSTARILLGSDLDKTLAFVDVNFRENRVSTAPLPTEGKPVMMSFNRSSAGQARFDIINQGNEGEVRSASSYRQLTSTRFVEESFRIPLPGKLRGVAVEDVNRDGHLETLFMFQRTDSSGIELAMTAVDTTGKPTQRVLSEDFLPGSPSSFWMWPTDFDGDDTLDIAVARMESPGEIWISKGRADQVFDPPVLVGMNGAFSRRDQLQIADFDGDGFLDLLVEPDSAAAVILIQGKRTMGFSGRTVLCQGEEQGPFSVGDIDRDNICDLIVAYPDKGMIAVHNGKRWRTWR